MLKLQIMILDLSVIREKIPDLWLDHDKQYLLEVFASETSRS